MTLLLAIIGLVIGLFADEAWGGLVGAVVGALLGNAWALNRQVRQLQFQVLQLQQDVKGRGRVEAPFAAAPAVSPAPSFAPAPRAVDAAPAFVAATAPEYGLVGSDVDRAGAALPRSSDEPFRLPPGPLAPLWRWLVGGNTIVKAGIAILFIGLAFLAKFASEQMTIPVELRLAAVGFAALVLMAVGWRLRRKRPAYAQVLQGGAVAVLYLTLFVAMRLFGVIGEGPALVGMLAVAAFSALLAVAQDARPLAVVGALGGFATPLLVATGGGPVASLFTLYLLIDVGIAAVAWHRTWRSLNLIGFVATFGVGLVWGLARYAPADYGVAQAFLVAFFLLFVAVMMMPGRRLGALDREPAAPLLDRLDRWADASLLFGLPTIVFALQWGLVHRTPHGVAVSAFVMAVFYGALAAWLRGRRAPVLFEATLAIAIVFATLVIPFALDASSVAGAWALEGAGVVWLGFRQRRGVTRAFGYGLVVVSGVALAVAYGRVGPITSVLNGVSLATLLLMAGSLIAGLMVSRHAPGQAHGADAKAELPLIGWACFWLVVAVAFHLNRLLHDREWLPTAAVACASVAALVFAELSRALHWRRVAWPAVAHAPLMACGVVGIGLLGAAPVDHGGWWVWPLAVATHVWLLKRVAARWPDRPRSIVHVLGVWLLATLGAMQGSALTLHLGDAFHGWSWLGWFAAPSLVIGWLSRDASAATWPVRDDVRAYRWTAAMPLSFAMLGFMLLANALSTGTARPLPYLPLLNPLDIGIAAVLVAVLAWWRRETWPNDGARLPVTASAFDTDEASTERPKVTGAFGSTPTLPPLATALAALLVVAGFAWLNGMLLRSFFHYADVPYDRHAWSRSLAVQTSLTLLWTLTALAAMWLSARRGWRAVWIVGGALLGLVVLKLLLVDLSASGTIARIVSFIGAGVVMLVIGYVAPLPSRRGPAITTGATNAP